MAVKQGTDITSNPEELFFRAVSVEGERRGMRLERIFWQLLERAAKEQNIALSDIAKSGNSTNLSSHMRAYAAIWANSRLTQAREIASFHQAVRTILACPTPAFIISADRRLRASNQAFQRYIRKFILVEDVELASKNLRLQIDMLTTDLIAQLKDETESVVNVGFTFGVNERRVRGRLNAVLATCWNEDLVAAYVVE